MKFYEYINNCLKAYGCRKAFGVPGSLVMPVWQNLKDIDIILCSHEQEASYVATGYSKISGELVAVITTGSPGVTNCVSGIASANMDSVPMLYISGRTPKRLKGYGVRQEEGTVNRTFDSVELLKPLTKCSIEITDISKAAQQFLESCNVAISGRAGCVHISIPEDIQSLDLLPYHEVPSIEQSSLLLEMPDITKPLIVLGWGCWQAKAVHQVYQLAEKIGAPILVTSKAYCCIWNDHPNYLGKLGYGYNPNLERFLQDYIPEQVLVFGSSMGKKDISDTCKCILQSAEVYLYSIEYEDIIFRFPSGHWIKTDNMAQMVGYWLKKLKPSRNNQNLIDQIQSNRKQQKEYFQEKIKSNDLMARAIVELNDLCDGSCAITADAGNHLLDTAVLYEPRQLGAMFLDDGIRAMGSGICSSVGMALASKDKYYIAVTGDGCMLMNGNVMSIAKRLELPILFLVVNNCSLGRVRVGQMNMGGFVASDLGKIDFSSYGKAFGLDAYKVRSMKEYRDAMKKILNQRTTSILEFYTDKNEIPISLRM